jgi:biopolymer transport protein ExbD
MPKVKIPRKSTAVDMTAMCDVAFLLLTFFILTTRFRPQEVAQINIPASTAQIPVPDKNILSIQIDPKGNVYFGVDDQNTREKLLFAIKERFNLPAFNEKQVKEFKLVEVFGFPLEQMPQFLGTKPEERSKFPQPGIPISDDKNQLIDLILLARRANPELRIAIKADKLTSYEDVNAVIQTLQKQKVNKFNLITTGRSASSDKE